MIEKFQDSEEVEFMNISGREAQREVVDFFNLIYDIQDMIELDSPQLLKSLENISRRLVDLSVDNLSEIVEQSCDILTIRDHPVFWKSAINALLMNF